MAHVEVLVEARKVWMDLFLADLTKRRYLCNAVGGGTSSFQPNVREVRLLDISIPEQAIPQLMSDLAPFARERSTKSSSKNKMALVSKGLREFGGLKPIYPEEDVPILWKDIPSFVPSFQKVFDLIDKPPFELPKVSKTSQALSIIADVKRIPSNIPYISWFTNKIEKIPFIGKRLITRRKEAWKSFVDVKVKEFDDKVEGLFNDYKLKLKSKKDLWLEKDVKETPYVGVDLNKLFRTLRPFVPEKEYQASDEVRHSWVNVIPIGWKEDPCESPEDGKASQYYNMLPKTPRGGELL